MFNNRGRDLDRRGNVIAGLSVVAVLFFMCLYFADSHFGPYKVLIQVADTESYPDETVPVFQVQATAEGDIQGVPLDSDRRYFIQDLIDEINRGEGYQILCDYQTDEPKEGEYEIQLVLEEELERHLAQKWRDIIRVEVKEGTLRIHSPLGKWDGIKFKRRDGSYVANEFLHLSGDTYYFDQNGERVTGEQEILGKVYYFLEDGRFDRERNKIDPALPMLALTFDDGPGKFTERLLDVLEENDSRATFFMLGTNVSKYPEAVKRMKEIGCEIGNHTTNHAKLTELEKEEILAQVESTNHALEAIISEKASVVRPPYGEVNELVKSTVSYPLIFWNVDTLDWESKNVKEIVDHTLPHVNDGDIVLMHDIYETTIDAAIELIIRLRDQGYQLVTVSEMAEARGITLENGKEYARFRPVTK